VGFRVARQDEGSLKSGSRSKGGYETRLCLL
jgi:hypothetical protein